MQKLQKSYLSSGNTVIVLFFLGFESSVEVTGPCLQIKIPYVKQNCNFLDITPIFVHIFTKHSSLREGLILLIRGFNFSVLCGFQNKCKLFPGKACFEFIVKSV